MQKAGLSRVPSGIRGASREVALVRVTGGGWADPENTADAPAARREAGLAQRIFLLHIWKCGGTQFCAVARANGESVNPDWGCHMPEPSRKSKWTPCADGRKFEEEFPQRTFVASALAPRPLRGSKFRCTPLLWPAK